VVRSHFDYPTALVSRLKSCPACSQDLEKTTSSMKAWEGSSIREQPGPSPCGDIYSASPEYAMTRKMETKKFGGLDRERGHDPAGDGCGWSIVDQGMPGVRLNVADSRPDTV
jgi:hypothetical protein